MRQDITGIPSYIKPSTKTHKEPLEERTNKKPNPICASNPDVRLVAVPLLGALSAFSSMSIFFPSLSARLRFSGMTLLAASKRQETRNTVTTFIWRRI